MARKRVAHFLLLSYLHNSPPNDAMRRAYDELGYDVEFFAPDNEAFNEENGTNIHFALYGFRWLMNHVASSRWRQYDAISCTSEDPVAIASVIAFFWRKPFIDLADEIKSGSYYGNRLERFKKLCRWGMRRAKLTIVNDGVRIKLQRDYAGLSPQQAITVYPGCFLEPPAPIDRDELRAEWGVQNEDFVISHSGTFGSNRGIEWILDALGENEHLKLLMQPLGITPLTRYFLANHRYRDNIILEEKRLNWRQAWQSTSGVDCGLVIYLDSGPQFQQMGISSNRLCMFLAMGVPVIATWQPSFEFIEEYNCGVLIRDSSEFNAAIATVRANQQIMAENALRCTKEYIDTAGKYAELKRQMQTALT